jgi:hypothetical protein
MKKQLLFLAIISLFAITKLSAQCTPVPFPPPALTNPDTSQGIPPAIATQIYNEVVNLRIPADTVLMGTTIPIDSIGVDSISGIPAAFTYATNSPNDYWLGGTYGCFIVTGNPTQADTGVYTMTLHTTIYLGHNPNNTQIYEVDFDFVVLDSSAVGFSDVKANQFVVRQNAPNPFDYKTTIRFHSPRAEVFTFEVYSIDGKLVRQEELNAEEGINKIEFKKGDLPSGMYIYQLANDNYTIRKRMIIR